MKWGLVITNRAERQLRRLSPSELLHIDRAFSEMCEDPFSADIKFLRGSDGALRRRVGDWRILYTLEQRSKLIIVAAVIRRGSKTY
jgi:mRNA-degrading endonuclease RelE of RelBE toxin-antitoxin system